MKVELMETNLSNVYTIGKKLLTKNLAPESEKDEYRVWNPYTSKLAALIMKGCTIPLQKNYNVLYLGAANGTTASYVSDILSEGMVFAVEFSPRAMQDLIKVSIPRINLFPIFADARYPESYRNMVSEVDLIYQDIAQRDQADIAVRNARLFLRKEGYLILMIKSRSIDSTKKTREVVDDEIAKLSDFNILRLVNLKPFHLDHIAVVAQMNR